MSSNGSIGAGVLWAAAAALASVAAYAMPDAAPHEVAPSAAAEPPAPFVWQHEHAKFSYFGITVRYSCDGLEAQVRRILVYLGARPDAKVRATGCPLPSSAPGRNAWVDAEFDVPAPAAPGDANAVSGASAQWRGVKLTPRQPNFLAAGDCELIEGMRDVFAKNLTLRGLEYRTSCSPGSLSPDSFEVSAQALHVIEPPGAGRRS